MYKFDVNEILHIATLSRSIEVIEIMVEKGFDVNVQDGALNTPLHVACQNVDLEVVEKLLASGSNVSARNVLDQTPLHSLLEDKFSTLYYPTAAWTSERMKFVRPPLFDPNKRDRNEAMARIAELLFAHGASLDISCHRDQEAAYHLVASTLENGVRLLVKYGFDVGLKSDRGFHLLHIAARRGQTEAVRALLKYVTPNYGNSANGPTTLRLAMKSYEKACVELLLDNDADVEDRTAIDAEFFFSWRPESVEILNILLRRMPRIGTIDTSHLYFWEMSSKIYKQKTAMLHKHYILMAPIRDESYYLLPKFHVRRLQREELEEIEFLKEIKREVNRLKKTRLTPNLTEVFSAFDLLAKDVDQVYQYVQDDVDLFFKSKFHFGLFPHYAIYLQFAYERAVRRRNLQDKCERLLINAKLTQNVARNILSYLKRDDLASLSKCASCVI